jgi:predicted alpha/beta superfamily hydrolase
MKTCACAAFASIIGLGMAPGADPGVTGTLETLESFPSRWVASRRIDVWLPPSYANSPDKKYPVLYMHDGQNLFDPSLSFLGIDWGVDETLTRLIAEGKVREPLVVGIWNTPQRLQEYLPEKMIHTLQPDRRKTTEQQLAALGFRLDASPLLSDAYLKFLVAELKPAIDRKYRTLSERENTFIMGSSAGGLISLYAVCEYPEVFGSAGCVSTHWPIAGGAMVEYARHRLPSPKTHRLYFDFGTETLDRDYEPHQRRMDAVMEETGFRSGVNWMTRKFPGAEHSERAWRERVHVPLEFLLRPPGR